MLMANRVHVTLRARSVLSVADGQYYWANSPSRSWPRHASAWCRPQSAAAGVEQKVLFRAALKVKPT